MSLVERAADFRLRLKIWAVAWASITAATAAAYVYFKAPQNLAWLWWKWLLSSAMKFLGLGDFPVIPPDWIRPSTIIEYASKNLPATVISTWSNDLFTLLQIPAYTAILLLLVFLIFFKKD